jgi:hypothetical protein
MSLGEPAGQEQKVQGTISETVNEFKERVDRVLTIDEVWDQIFERKVSRWLLYRKTKTGDIPSFKVGSRTFIRLSALYEWMAEQEARKLRKEQGLKRVK